MVQSVEDGIFHNLDDLGEVLMTGGLGSRRSPPQFGRNDVHGSLSPVGDRAGNGGAGDPFAATVGSPSNCADNFDPIGLRAGPPPETPRRRNRAVPHRGGHSPAARSPNLSIDQVAALNVNSPSDGKGKGKGKKT